MGRKKGGGWEGSNGHGTETTVAFSRDAPVHSTHKSTVSAAARL